MLDVELLDEAKPQAVARRMVVGRSGFEEWSPERIMEITNHRGMSLRNESKDNDCHPAREEPRAEFLPPD